MIKKGKFPSAGPEDSLASHILPEVEQPVNRSEARRFTTLRGKLSGDAQ